MRMLTDDAACETPLLATVGAVIASLFVVTGSAQAVAIVCKPSGKHIVATECERPPGGTIAIGDFEETPSAVARGRHRW